MAKGKKHITLSDLPDSTTLGEVRALVKHMADDGVDCPACDQHAKIYRRHVNASMAKSLITMYVIGGTTDFVHLPTQVGSRSREEGKLAYWGLVVESEGTIDGQRAGYWKVTERGEKFVRRALSVPDTALVYNGECFKLEGPPVDIIACLGTKFSYVDLMNSKPQSRPA